jgi:hypothetical protein
MHHARTGQFIQRQPDRHRGRGQFRPVGRRKGRRGISLNTKGKVIISSLEMNSTNNQYIHWQRCTGSMTAASAYGVEGAVVTGLGPTGNQVTATSDVAVMFVEVWYQQRACSDRCSSNP